MARSIQRLREGDSKVTMLRTWFANRVVNTCNSFLNLQVKPDGAGKLVVGEDGRGAILELKPATVEVESGMQFITTVASMDLDAGEVPEASDLITAIESAYASLDPQRNPVPGEIVLIRRSNTAGSQQVMFYGMVMDGTNPEPNFLTPNFDVSGNTFWAVLWQTGIA